MGIITTDWEKIPLSKEINTLNVPINVDGFDAGVAVNIGNPHIVFFGKSIENVGDVLETIANNDDGRLTWQSMYWTPDGSKLLISAGNRSQRWLEWQFWDDDGQHVINQFIPTQEQFFFLHFFEQFAHSHQIISTDSTHFYFSGYEAPNQRVDMPARPWVFKGLLEEGAGFEALEHGLFPTVRSRAIN